MGPDRHCVVVTAAAACVTLFAMFCGVCRAFLARLFLGLAKQAGGALCGRAQSCSTLSGWLAGCGVVAPLKAACPHAGLG